MSTHVSKNKKEIVEEFKKLLEEYPIIAAVNMENLPAKQLQKMRALLRDKVEMRMTKKRLVKIAIDQVKEKKPNLDQLVPYLKGMPALIFTKENPFTLYKIIQKNKSMAPIRGGQITPKDIVVPAGPTSFAPGPVIGQLGAAGIPAGIEEGKVAIKKDTVVAKEGDTVNTELAGLLTRLGIEPMEIGLDLTAVYEDGSIFKKDVLAIDEQEYIDNVAKCHQWAFNLAVEAGIYNSTTINFMITKAFSDAKALALSQFIVNKDTVNDVLAKAEMQAASLKSVAKL